MDLILLLLATVFMMVLMPFSVLVIIESPETHNEISKFFKQVFNLTSRRKNKEKESNRILSEVQKKAKSDAENDNFNIRYEGNPKKQEQYNDYYKTCRKEIVEYYAFHDAEQIFLYNYDELDYKPFLLGPHLTIPAEIAEYQGLFVEEKARLEEFAKKESTHIDELKEHLKALYADDYQKPLDPKDFNKIFQLGDNVELIQNSVPERSVSAREIVNNNSRKGDYSEDTIAIIAGVDDAENFKPYNNIFRGIGTADYHVSYFNKRMKIIESLAEENVKQDINDYDEFKNHLLFRRNVRKDKSELIPVCKDFTFDFNEKKYYTKKYREIMASMAQSRDINVEVPVYETVDKKYA